MLMRQAVRPVRILARVAIALTLAGAAATATAQEQLFQSRRITSPQSTFKGIEGPAVDAAGNLYVVNFKHKGTIGRLRPGQADFEPFTTLDNGSIGNGIRFDRAGRMYVADFKRRQVLVIEPGQTKPVPYFASKDFRQPNDLAIAENGTIYASDPPFGAINKGKTGQIWRISRGADGKVSGEVIAIHAAPNGIDLSPDGKTLYVSEDRQVLAYQIRPGKLAPPTPIHTFPPGSELDGLRTDRDGRIFVTRALKSGTPGKGAVAILRPDGTAPPEVQLNGRRPRNLTFGGPDGKTVFVAQDDGDFIEAFRTDRPGREPCLQVPAAC